MTITGETTVSQVATLVPASIRIFERYGIDFCCGGNKPLGEACRDRGVAVDQFLAEVEKAQQTPEGSKTRNWESATLAELIDHILAKHHVYLKAELPRLAQLLAKVTEAHGQRHGESLRPLGKLYTGLKRELEDHMWKEENILFPLIQQMETGIAMGPRGMSVSSPIRVMEMEHESAGQALREMRQVTANYQAPEDGCQSYQALFQGLQTLEADLHEHIHLENHILFPKAVQLEES